jgi:hypothetical protein
VSPCAPFLFLGDSASCIFLRVVLARVLLEVLLRNAVECEAATVLSRRGVVIPHRQREQHHPLKSSPSTLIKRLSINEPLICVEVRTRVADSHTPHTQLPRATD